MQPSREDLDTVAQYSKYGTIIAVNEAVEIAKTKQL
jgi:hypothetical protein